MFVRCHFLDAAKWWTIFYNCQRGWRIRGRERERDIFLKDFDVVDVVVRSMINLFIENLALWGLRGLLIQENKLSKCTTNLGKEGGP